MTRKKIINGTKNYHGCGIGTCESRWQHAIFIEWFEKTLASSLRRGRPASPPAAVWGEAGGQRWAWPGQAGAAVLGAAPGVLGVAGTDLGDGARSRGRGAAVPGILGVAGTDLGDNAKDHDSGEGL